MAREIPLEAPLTHRLKRVHIMIARDHDRTKTPAFQSIDKRRSQFKLTISRRRRKITAQQHRLDTRARHLIRKSLRTLHMKMMTTTQPHIEIPQRTLVQQLQRISYYFPKMKISQKQNSVIHRQPLMCSSTNKKTQNTVTRLIARTLRTN